MLFVPFDRAGSGKFPTEAGSHKSKQKEKQEQFGDFLWASEPVQLQ
jgi:hypothetical protein